MCIHTCVSIMHRHRLATEADGHHQSDLRAAGRRYFSAPAVRRERSKQLKRLKLAAEEAEASSAVAAVLGLGRAPGTTCTVRCLDVCHRNMCVHPYASMCLHS